MLFLYLLAALSVHVEAEWSYIRHSASGLLLDGTDEVIKLEYFAGSPAQRWEEQHIGQGEFYIQNQKTGKFITIREGLVQKADVITFKKENGDNQKWYINSNGTIVSAGIHLALDIGNSNARAGQELVALPTRSTTNQQFLFQSRN